jgi:hypothetical protein
VPPIVLKDEEHKKKEKKRKRLINNFIRKGRLIVFWIMDPKLTFSWLMAKIRVHALVSNIVNVLV